MLKVFLTEDERLVREGLRDMIPWEQYGFVFAGEASDGEMALPLVRKIKPDVLITDIKMPFMDGLAFSRLVSKELPATKIIILSGYDDFAYAQQAIELHVDQYLLKPVTRASMIQALEQTKARIEEERDQQDYRRRFVRESQEYEHYARRVFFEKLVGGELPVPEIYEQADRLELELDAEAYNIVLFTLQPKENITAYSEQSAALQDNLLQDFLQYPDFLVFRGSALSYAVLLKGNRGQIETMTRRCAELIEQRCTGVEAAVDWYVAVGTPTERLSSLPRCYAAANHALAYRHLMPNTHILKTEMTERSGELSAYSAADQGRLDPTLIQRFIQNGLDTEIEDFTNEFFDGLGEACESLMFRHYLLLSARINALAAAEKLSIQGISAEIIKLGIVFPNNYELCLSSLKKTGKLLVVDRMEDVADGASKANSGIVHAGFDAKPGSLMARLNVRGNAVFESYFSDYAVNAAGSIVGSGTQQSVVVMYTPTA